MSKPYSKDEQDQNTRALIARKVYEEFLFHFEKVHNEATKFRMTNKLHQVKLQDLDPSYLREAKVINL